MVSFELYLIYKNLRVTDTGEMYVELEFAEELYKPIKPQIQVDDETTNIIEKTSQAMMQMMKKIFPNTPNYVTPFIRLFIILKYSDYEKLEKKPDVGDKVTIEFFKDKIVFK
jgi:hypothetical protein